MGRAMGLLASVVALARLVVDALQVARDLRGHPPSTGADTGPGGDGQAMPEAQAVPRPEGRGDPPTSPGSG